MEICEACNKEIVDATVETCSGRAYIEYPDGSVLPAVKYDPGKLHFPKWFRCPDCNVVPGGIHHLNCDQEICPKCGGQLICCDCFQTAGALRATPL